LKAGQSKDDMAEFYELYRRTRKRLGLPAHPYRFFTSLWDKFSPRGQMMLWLAEHQEQVIAGHIFFRFNGRVSVDFLGWDKRFYRTSPNHFLFWEQIKGAQNDRFKVYDFGRTSPDNAGLMAFKGRWGTRVADLPVFSYPGNGKRGRNNKERGILYSWQARVQDRPARPSILWKVCFNHLA
jgi:lipid II:glycine glycyltransferase (peptidoglycan interpeptide bridge formation enzyme)